MHILNTNTNIFDLPDNNYEPVAVCVTTNGITKRNGAAVMGKGIALEADQKFGVSAKLGKLLQTNGNHVYLLGQFPTQSNNTFSLLSFPTKHDWRNPSDINLIRQSARELIAKCIELDIKVCYLPPVGCGCGGLNFYRDVKPVLSDILTPTIGIDFITVLRP